MSTTCYDKQVSNSIIKITDKKNNRNLNNLRSNFFYCNQNDKVNINSDMTKKSDPIDIPKQLKTYNYDNTSIGPNSPNDNINNNKDLNSILSKYSISPNTYSNFEINKYHNNEDNIQKISEETKYKLNLVVANNNFDKVSGESKSNLNIEIVNNNLDNNIFPND